jgi:peroxiredoxin
VTGRRYNRLNYRSFFPLFGTARLPEEPETLRFFPGLHPGRSGKACLAWASPVARANCAEKLEYFSSCATLGIAMRERQSQRAPALLRLGAVLSLALGSALGCGSATESSDDLIPGWTPNPEPKLAAAACDTSPAGRNVGDPAEEFALQDANGETVRLSDYCGKVVYLALGAMWCSECAQHAEDIPALVDEFGSDEFSVLTLMTEDPDFEPPEANSLAVWAATYDLDTPVLADPNWGVWDRYYRYHAAPGQLLVGKDGRIIKHLSFDAPEAVTRDDIAAALGAK